MLGKAFCKGKSFICYHINVSLLKLYYWANHANLLEKNNSLLRNPFYSFITTKDIPNVLNGSSEHCGSHQFSQVKICLHRKTLKMRHFKVPECSGPWATMVMVVIALTSPGKGFHSVLLCITYFPSGRKEINKQPTGWIAGTLVIFIWESVLMHPPKPPPSKKSK